MSSFSITEYNSIRERIIKDFNHLWEMNDAAHRQQHFDAVFSTALTINHKLNLGYDPKLMLFVAYFHDLFSWSRHNHELLSAMYIATTDYELIRELDPLERILVGQGCSEHRASNTEPFSCGFSELMNAADRELPDVTGRRIIERALVCSLAKHPDLETNAKKALSHVKEKFGMGGYARYPELYSEAFGDQLEEMRYAISNMTLEQVYLFQSDLLQHNS